MRLAQFLSVGVVAGLVVAWMSDRVVAQETGGVSATFVLKGDVPKLPAPIVNKDQQVCGANGAVPNESLVVDPATKGIANVFVWIKRVNERDIPADLKKPKEDTVVIDNKNCVFVPHCLIVRAGQSLNAINSDGVSHNVRATLLRNGTFNDSLPPNDKEGVTRELTKGEILPQPIQCDIHPWMGAHMLVVDHPYAALSDAKGSFTIEGLKPDKYDFTVWHESAGYLRNIKQLEDVEVKAGQPVDLGKIEVDASALLK